MEKTAFGGLGYAAEKVLDRYLKEPPKVDIGDVNSINSFVSGAPQPFSNNQLMLAPLLGAGAGGLYGFFAGNPKTRKRDAIMGALGGGLIGGGAALGYKHLGGSSASKARELNTVPEEVFQQNKENLKLLEDYQKSWNPLKGELVEVGTGKPIANTELPFRIEKAKKLQELWPQIPEAAGNYQQQRAGIGGGMAGGMAGLTLAKILDSVVPPAAAKNTKPKKDKKDKDMNNKEKKADDKNDADRLSGIESGGALANTLHGTPMAYGAGLGGAAALMHEFMRRKSDAEKAQPAWRKAMRYAGKGGLGALAGTGVGGIAGNILSNAVTQKAHDNKLDAYYKLHDEQKTLSRGTNGWVPNPPPVSEIAREQDEYSDALARKALVDTAFGKSGGAKQADLYGSYLGGSNLGTLGGVAGAGLGGLYGLASGAYQAEKGKKLQGALRGAGRGALGGGLLGGGTGLGMGAAMGAQVPFSEIINLAKMKDSPERHEGYAALREKLKNINPDMFAGLTTAGTLGGAALGGYAADKALNKKKEDEDKKEAELKLSPLAGVKKPDNDKGMSLNNLLEQARKKREENEKKQPAQKAASALLEALKEAASTPEYRKGHKAQNRARYAALLKADGGRARSFTGANPALLDAHHYNYVKDRWAADKEDQKWDAADGGNRHAKTIERANSKPEQTKASAYEFGKTVKRAFPDLTQIGNTIKDTWNSPTVQGFVNDPTTRAGLTYGGIGAGLGGLYGLINPGEYEDETGNVRRRGRLSGALRGALGGGALGGLAGAGAQEGRFQYLKHLMNQRAGFPNAMGGLDRSEALENAEAFAQNNPSAVGALGTSPLQGAQNAYSAASNAVKGFMPKRMGKAPTTGVDIPKTAPEVKTTDNPA